MAQKVNPIVLRLQQTNRYFDSCWYSDLFYADLFTRDIQIQQYMLKILKQIQYPSARIFIQDLPKKSKIFIVFNSPIKSRSIRSKFLHLQQYPHFLKHPFLENEKRGKVVSKSVPSEKLFQKKKSFLPKPPKTLYRDSRSILQLKSKGSFSIFPLTLSLTKLMIPQLEPFFATQTFLTRKKQTKSKIHYQKTWCNKLRVFFSKKKQNIEKKSLNSINSRSFNLSQKQFYIRNILFLYKHLQRYSAIFSSYQFLQHICWFLFLKKKIVKNFFFLLHDQKKLSTFSSRGNIKTNCSEKSTCTTDSKTVCFTKKREKNQGNNFSQLLAIYSPFFSIFTEKNQYTYREHMEATLSSFHFNAQIGQKDSFLYFMKIVDDYKSALFLANEIVFYLERRIPFRKIKNRIVKEVKRKEKLKGIRISCSGRVGGRSKKAQRSRTESIKYGQTSLHVFSSKIDFASKKAMTPFGVVGVKVWICYN